MSNLPALVTQHAYDTGALILQALDDHGFVKQRRDGGTFGVSFSDLVVYGARYFVYVIDTKRLPVPAAKLIHADTLFTLQSVIKMPVRALSGGNRGIMFVVQAQPKERVRLPDRVEFNLSGLPDDMPFAVPFGSDGGTALVYRSLLDTGHVIVGGTTGGGKSNFLQGWLAALLTREQPGDLRVALVDPKQVEFTAWRDAPHLYGKIALDLESATALTVDLLQEVERRLTLFASAGNGAGPVRNWQAYVTRHENDLPLIVLFVDEFIDLAEQGGTRSKFYSNLTRLVSMARAAGVVLVLSATNPKAEVINTTMRANCDTRIAFRCRESHQSRAILERSGAERLPNVKGRALIGLPGSDQPVEIQTLLLPDDTLGQLAAWVRGLGRAEPSDTHMQATGFTGGIEALTKDERATLAVVVSDLDGRFTVRDVFDHLRGRVLRSSVSDISKLWRSRGWLADAGGPNDGSIITDKLYRELGLTMAAFGVSQPQEGGVEGRNTETPKHRNTETPEKGAS